MSKWLGFRHDAAVPDGFEGTKSATLKEVIEPHRNEKDSPLSVSIEPCFPPWIPALSAAGDDQPPRKHSFSFLSSDESSSSSDPDFTGP